MFKSNIRLPFAFRASDVVRAGGSNVQTHYAVQVSGILRIEDGALCFQFRRNTYMQGQLQSQSGLTGQDGGEADADEAQGIEDVCVPVTHVLSVVFKRSRWFSSRFILEANDLRAFEALPGAMGGTKLSLRIRKQHADLAETLASHLQLWLSKRTLHHFDNDVD